MTKRNHMAADGLVIGRAGYDAYPGMPEIGKAFDSSWPWAGIILGSGTYSDPSAVYISATGNSTGHTLDPTPHTFVTNQFLPSSYSHMIVLLRQITGTTTQNTVLLPVYFSSHWQVHCPRIARFRRWAGTNHPPVTANTRLNNSPYSYIILGA